MICRIDFYKNKKSTTKRKTRRKEKCGQKNLLNDSALFPPHSPAGVFPQVGAFSRGTCGRFPAGWGVFPGNLRARAGLGARRSLQISNAPSQSNQPRMIIRAGVASPPQNAMTSALLLLSQETLSSAKRYDQPLLFLSQETFSSAKRYDQRTPTAFAGNSLLRKTS